MNTADFGYPLPRQLIAQTPLEPRDHSRLMVLRRRDGSILHCHFYEIVEFLQPGDALVLNDSRVLKARLYGLKQGTPTRVEILLLHRLGPGVWQSLVRPGKKLPPGSIVELGVAAEESGPGQPGGKQVKEERQAWAEVVAQGEGGTRIVRFSGEEALERLGRVPLPPYIHAPLSDQERYQTVYSRVPGSAAAPTAGLHFTPQLLDTIKAMGVEIVTTTLHVGLDTFRPVRALEPRLHPIHREFCDLSQEAAERLNLVKKNGGRIVCVGTTTARVLEQAAAAEDGEGISPFQGWTSLFILPGHNFKAIDALVTNLHLPRSTLLMLVSAFAGRDLILRAYQEAIASGYRFYSFGDAMLVI